jgi:hypothetical protein
MIEKIWIQMSEFLVSKWNWVQKNIAKGIGWVMAQIQGLDPAEVLADVERQYALKQQRRQEQNRRRLAEIETQRAGTLDELERERVRKNRERQEAYGRRLAGADRELQDLIRQRDQAIAEAAEAAEKARKGAGGDDIRKRLEAALEGMELDPLERAAGPAGAGTFHAFAAARMGSANWQRRLLKANEETAENTRTMKKQNRQQGIPVQ